MYPNTLSSTLNVFICCLREEMKSRQALSLFRFYSKKSNFYLGCGNGRFTIMIPRQHCNICHLLRSHNVRKWEAPGSNLFLLVQCSHSGSVGFSQVLTLLKLGFFTFVLFLLPSWVVVFTQKGSGKNISKTSIKICVSSTYPSERSQH